MAEPTPISVEFPVKGIDVSGEYGVQRPGTTPVGVNVRTTDPILERDRGGSRHGLLKYPTAQVTGGANLVQHITQFVELNADFLLAAFEDYESDFVSDASTNNLRTRNPPGRKVPPKGSGVQPNRNRPSNPRRRVSVAASATLASNGSNVTLTATLTKQNVNSIVAGATLLLTTSPAGQNGDGTTAVTNGSGVAVFTVNEATYEGVIRYLISNEYTVA